MWRNVTYIKETKIERTPQWENSCLMQCQINHGRILQQTLARGYDSILVVCDCLTKMVHFIPTTEKTLAEGLVVLFQDHVWKLHGPPESIISDRGT